MFGAIVKRVLGTANDRYIKSLHATVAKINDLEPEFEALSDDEVRTLTPKFQARLAAGETIDDLLPEAFAAVREAAKRTLGQRHFDVQLMGGIVLHTGMIAEMKTGEGKTLVATLAVYLNALEGKGVHVVTGLLEALLVFLLLVLLGILVARGDLERGRATGSAGERRQLRGDGDQGGGQVGDEREDHGNSGQGSAGHPVERRRSLRAGGGHALSRRRKRSSLASPPWIPRNPTAGDPRSAGHQAAEGGLPLSGPRVVPRMPGRARDRVTVPSSGRTPLRGARATFERRITVLGGMGDACRLWIT